MYRQKQSPIRTRIPRTTIQFLYKGTTTYQHKAKQSPALVFSYAVAMDTLEFVVNVKSHFSTCNQIERYYQFANALKDFKSHKIHSSAAVSIVKSAFEGHENILNQFLMFLPPNLQQSAAEIEQEKQQKEPPLEIQETESMEFDKKQQQPLLEIQETESMEFDEKQQQQPPLEIQETESMEFDEKQQQPLEIQEKEEEATEFKEKESHLKTGIAFVNKVRSRFGGGSGNGVGVYRAFLKTMCKYRKKKMSIDEIYNDVLDLFHGHADLIHEFEGFLEDNPEKVLKKIRAFAMEDRMHGVDVLLSNLDSTIEKAERILLKNGGEKENVEVEEKEEGFSALNLRCFERLYGESGCQLVEMLKEKPQAVLPRVLPRLKMKREELVRARKVSHQFWGELHRLRKQSRKRKTSIVCAHYEKLNN
ncbi:hypothetical protein M9H77_17236 [Catharanthus roseus]|uniref:Uncharacterized protein n=1 Tax=Catharanthus roseus TaxID=4058 RepID=A0ACC0B409_CATRO|nr:hypothetical protein M9H77_17236 [Catharanthus roseus]